VPIAIVHAVACSGALLEPLISLKNRAGPLVDRRSNGTGLSGSLAAALFQAVDPRPQLHGR